MQSSTKNKKTHPHPQNNKIKPSTTKFLFRCCKPAVMEDEMLRSDVPPKTRSHGRNTANRLHTILKYVHEDDGRLAFSSQFQPYTSNDGKESVDGKKKKNHKKFTHVLKAVWFETPLAKRIKNRKSTNHEPREEPNGSVILEAVGKESNATRKKSPDNLPSKGSFPATSAVKLTKKSNLPLRHSQSASSVTSCLRPMGAMRNPPLIQPNSVAVMQQQQMQEEYGKGCHSTNYGLCLILISLLVLVLWGKACAIICTSTWLFLVPLVLQSDRKRRSNWCGRIDGQEKDTLQYKKKVIMEGLIERTNHNNPFVTKE